MSGGAEKKMREKKIFLSPIFFSPDCKMGKISGAQKAACFARIP